MSNPSSSWVPDQFVIRNITGIVTPASDPIPHEHVKPDDEDLDLTCLVCGEEGVAYVIRDDPPSSSTEQTT